MKTLVWKTAAVLTFIGFFGQSAHAQCCQPIPNATPGISYTYILTNGTNASGVAYNPNFDYYYALTAGNPGFPLETFTSAGVAVYQTNTGFDSRGLWWNPTLGQLEANGFNNLGWWNFAINASGHALNTGTQLFTGQFQPNSQSCGDLDYDANEVIFYDNGSIYRYDRATSALLGNYPLVGIPVATSNINSTSVGYTGCPGYEIAILDYVNKIIYFFDKSNGNYSGQSILPAATVTNTSFRFSWANNLAWLYELGTRTWHSFNVMTSGPGGSSNILGPDTTICTGQNLTLDATTAGATYSWQDASTNATFSTTVAGTYWVDIDVAGCITRDSIVVTLLTPTTSVLGNDTTICQGTTLVLDATTSGATYTWQDASTNPTLNAAAAGTYWVDIDLNGCVGRDTIIITTQPAPNPNLGADTLLCPNATLVLDATTPGATYTWHDLSTNPTFTVNAAGTYYVDVDDNGCIGQDTITVTYVVFTPVDAGPDVTYCDGDPLNDLISMPMNGGTMNWYSDPNLATNIGTGTNLTPTNSIGSITYYVAETTSGCESPPDSVVVTINPVPAAPALSGSANYCQGDPLNDLIATIGSGGTITWYSDPGLTNQLGTGTNLTPNTTLGVTTYYATESVGGCEGLAGTIDVTILPTPLAPTISPDVTYCIGDPINDLIATPLAGTIDWYNDPGLQNNIASGNNYTPPASPGSFTYYATETVQGCVSPAASVTVTIIPGPTAMITGDTSICIGESAILNGSGTGDSFSWSTGSTNNTITVTPAATTNYTFTYTNACGSASANVTVTVNPFPIADAGVDTLIGLGSTITLNPSGGSSYFWSPPDYLSCELCENPEATPLESTWYYVIVTDSNGCVSNDSVYVEVTGDISIFVPNIFSPNGDGINDVLYVRGNGIETLQFVIYDRWGQKVFESQDQDLGWDGSLNGKMFNTAAFAFVVKAQMVTGEFRTVTGNVTLIR